jgi:hypothetical protein
VYLAGPMLFRVGSENATASNFVQISKKAWRRPCQWLDKRWGEKAWARQAWFVIPWTQGQVILPEILVATHQTPWRQDPKQQNITVPILDIIRRSVNHLEQNASETGLCLRLNPIGVVAGVRRQRLALSVVPN